MDKINPDEFMNTYDEFHSFVIGAAEGATLFIPSKVRLGKKVREMVQAEYWYYQFGRMVGFLGLAAIGIILGVILT
jgi:hypothetical protein